MTKTDISMGQDSFLDIVANLVGILIILVVIVGAQATTAWQVVETSAQQENELAETVRYATKEAAKAENLRQENAELHAKLDYEQTISKQLSKNRHRILVAIEQAKNELSERKRALGKKEAETHELIGEIEAIKQKIQQVKYEFSAVEHHTKKNNVQTIKHYPTPIAKTVFADEIHFRIMNGRIAYVPMDELVTAMKNEWRIKAQKLENAQNTWESVGPIQNFRMQYLLQVERKKKQSFAYGIRFQKFEIRGLSNRLGEEIKVALTHGSDFISRLSRMEPGKTTVSVWVYPDDYENFIEIRNWLRQNNFQTASWPMRNGQPISGGPQGFRTSTN